MGNLGKRDREFNYFNKYNQMQYIQMIYRNRKYANS